MRANRALRGAAGHEPGRLRTPRRDRRRPRALTSFRHLRHHGVRPAALGPRGMVFTPFFAGETLINLVVQDTYCPLKEPDFKKTCVSIEKI
ncbi:MAG: hypothetical protein ACLSDQ_14125 [Adlercreutzia equolifaciens]